MKEHALRLSRIVTDPDQYEGLSTSISEDLFIRGRACWENDLRHILPAMVQESAHEVIIPARGVSTDINAIRNPVQWLPQEMKQRVRLIDKNRSVWKRVLHFFNPLANELDERDKLIFPDDDPRKPGIYLPRVCFEEKLLFVLRSFYFLSLASREQAEADIRIRSVLRTIRDVRRVLKDDEALFRLDQFRGLLRLYEPAKIPSLKYVASELTPSVERRLVQLLDEAEIIEMSEHRRLVGLTGLHPRLVWLRLARAAREVTTRNRYRDIVGIGNEVIGVMRSMGYKLPNVPTVIERSYNPPLIDLKPLRLKVARNRPVWLPGRQPLVQDVADLVKRLS